MAGTGAEQAGNYSYTDAITRQDKAVSNSRMQTQPVFAPAWRHVYCLWLLATPAIADTTLYVQANLGLESAQAQGSPSVTRVSDYSSRIGLRGKAPLADGWRAIWQLETGMRLDDGSSTHFASRDSYAGVAGPLGELRLGKHDSPYKLISGGLDLFGSRTASYSTLFHNNGAGWNNGLPKVDSRLNNAVGYWTPSGRNWQFNLMYGADETRSSSHHSPIWSGSARYVLGKLQLGAGAEWRPDQNSNHDAAQAWQMLAGYEFSSRTQLGAGLEYLRLAAERRPGWVVALQQPVGALQLKAVFAGAAATGAVAADGQRLDNGAWHATLGFDYGLSRHLNLIGFYSSLNNHSQGSYEFTSNPLGANPLGIAGHDSQVLALGFMYKH